MKKLLLIAMVFALLLTGCAQPTVSPTAEPEPTPHHDTAREVYPGEAWQEATTPEQLGWSSEKLAKAREYSERIGSAAVMIVDDGIVVDAWGDMKRNYHCHSVRKSLLSASINRK